MSEPERSSLDDVIDVYKRDVDVTLIRENLKLSPSQRVEKLMAVLRGVELLRSAVQASLVRERPEEDEDDPGHPGCT